jgi:hypothetical protein
MVANRFARMLEIIEKSPKKLRRNPNRPRAKSNEFAL